MDRRSFQIFVIRYIGDITSGEAIDIALCMNQAGSLESPYLACDCIEDWEKVSARFPDADVHFLAEWCAALRKNFCSPDTSLMTQEALKNCSTNIDVAVSQMSLDATEEPDAAMSRLLRAHFGMITRHGNRDAKIHSETEPIKR
jgi:hypothetical protein